MEIQDFIDGDFFESLADFSFGDPYGRCLPIDLNILQVFLNSFREARPPRIFVNSDRVLEFFKIAESIDREMILISHNGDFNFAPSHLAEKPPCITKWFGQNLNIPTLSFLTSLPIGLERRRWFPELNKQQRLLNFSRLMKSPKELLYINHNPHTNNSKRAWIYDHFKDKNLGKIALSGNGSDYIAYLSDIINHQFVLCPDGNGIDCHRQWETLYLNRFPVIERNACHSNVYKDLPVLLVDSFEELTPTLLEGSLESLRAKQNQLSLTSSTYRRVVCD